MVACKTSWEGWLRLPFLLSYWLLAFVLSAQPYSVSWRSLWDRWECHSSWKDCELFQWIKLLELEGQTQTLHHSGLWWRWISALASLVLCPRRIVWWEKQLCCHLFMCWYFWYNCILSYFLSLSCLLLLFYCIFSMLRANANRPECEISVSSQVRPGHAFHCTETGLVNWEGLWEGSERVSAAVWTLAEWTVSVLPVWPKGFWLVRMNSNCTAMNCDVSKSANTAKEKRTVACYIRRTRLMDGEGGNPLLITCACNWEGFLGCLWQRKRIMDLNWILTHLETKVMELL